MITSKQADIGGLTVSWAIRKHRDEEDDVAYACTVWLGGSSEEAVFSTDLAARLWVREALRQMLAESQQLLAAWIDGV